MTVLEKRFRGKLSELKPLAKNLPLPTVQRIVNEVFLIEFIEPNPARPFVFVCKNGINWYLRPESRQGTGKQYWVMRKTIGGNRITKYLSPVGELTLATLQEKTMQALREIK